ncbi:MAG: DUF3445 domain-containing protein [Hyphomicrobiales bacterium]
MTVFHKPFAIGLLPLNLSEWLDVDGQLEFYLEEKDRLYDAHPDLVFQAEEGTQASQDEILQSIIECLIAQYPSLYQKQGDVMSIGKRQVLLDDQPPLLTAARLCQDDLILMRHGPQGWRLVAASLSFPSSWSLVEKFGKPMDQIHAPVPAFGPNTRNAMMIDRIFDKLQVELPVWRQNWSLHEDDALYHPSASMMRPEKFENRNLTHDPYVRVERQTLRKMPRSGDILFTVRIYLDRVSALRQKPEGEAGVAQLNEQLANMTADELTYKGIPFGLTV